MTGSMYAWGGSLSATWEPEARRVSGTTLALHCVERRRSFFWLQEGISEQTFDCVRRVM
jgi:hypothetical protein